MAFRRLGPLLFLLAVFSPLRATAAEGDQTPTAVLGIEPLDGVPDALASDATDALRQRVASSRDYKLLQGKDLVEVKLVFACPDEAPACLSQAGKSLGASKLIYGNIKKAGRRLPDHAQAAGRRPGGGRELRDGRHRQAPTPTRPPCTSRRPCGWAS